MDRDQGVQLALAQLSPTDGDQRILLIGTKNLLTTLQDPVLRPLSADIAMKLQMPPCTVNELRTILQHGLWQGENLVGHQSTLSALM